MGYQMKNQRSSSWTQCLSKTPKMEKLLCSRCLKIRWPWRGKSKCDSNKKNVAEKRNRLARQQRLKSPNKSWLMRWQSIRGLTQFRLWSKKSWSLVIPLRLLKTQYKPRKIAWSRRPYLTMPNLCPSSLSKKLKGWLLLFPSLCRRSKRILQVRKKLVEIRKSDANSN